MVEYNEGKNPNIVSPQIRQSVEISTSGVGPIVTTPVHFDATVTLTTKRLILRSPAERDLPTISQNV